MHFTPSFCKNASPTFSMVHLLHCLYGVDAPDPNYQQSSLVVTACTTVCVQRNNSSFAGRAKWRT